MTTTSALSEALRRDAAVLLDAYRTGAWVPDPVERDLAEGLARGRWDAHLRLRGRNRSRCQYPGAQWCGTTRMEHTGAGWTHALSRPLSSGIRSPTSR